MLKLHAEMETLVTVVEMRP